MSEESDMYGSRICSALRLDMSDGPNLENFQKTIIGWVCLVKSGHARSFQVRTDLENSLEILLVDIWRIGQ
jgi:hypothetical protein